MCQIYIINNILTIIMEQIQFPTSFLIGHAVIDDDHRRLVGLLNKMKSCFAERLGNEARDTCIVLQNFMEEHNDREENILRDAAFPRLDGHKKSHERDLEAYRHILTGCGTTCLKNAKDYCTNQLAMSVIEHIVSNDLDFKSFLQAEGIAEGAE